MKSIDTYFNKADIKKLTDNFFKVIDNDWMLITAGTSDSFNMMTASWGTLGILWNKPIAICFIRPHRYTFGFAEKAEHYSLSFFTETHRRILNICGNKSGRNIDKIAETGLVPLITEHESIGYEQARMVIECKKLYADYLKESNFIIPEIARKNYPAKDYHKFYIGEILNCYVK